MSEERKEKQIKKLEEIAHHCNVNKLAAKRVSEGGIEVFFTHFVKDNGPIPLDSTVVAVLDRSIDVLLHDLHLIKRLYFEVRGFFKLFRCVEIFSHFGFRGISVL